MSEFDKPSRAEDEYFAREELERRKKWAQEQAAKMETEEKERLKQLHYMKCPKCGMDLHTIEFQGISLDKCPTCNGTWFDGGELEQLLSPQNSGLFGRMMSIFR
ncbi:MAG TPA: zf-TFIIB domain-containing protein [Thermoanaerobaculia bacterium]|nr:zf-TFIIB domain-containing protein [Thermoanaerobaculia bacterium]